MHIANIVLPTTHCGLVEDPVLNYKFFFFLKVLNKYIHFEVLKAFKVIKDSRIWDQQKFGTS